MVTLEKKTTRVKAAGETLAPRNVRCCAHGVPPVWLPKGELNKTAPTDVRMW